MIFPVPKKIGDYPIITAKEALDLLASGNYVTSVSEKMPGKNYVAKAESVYVTEPDYTKETFVPYCRFSVEMPDMREKNGLKTYGAYYDPAVYPFLQCLRRIPV